MIEPHAVREWTHPICSFCYEIQEPGRDPSRVIKDVETELCCFCEAETDEGIYYRYDPDKLLTVHDQKKEA